MNLINNLDRNNLHHAYLIEGDKEEIIPELFSFIESLNIKTSANPDFYQISLDSFKIDDAHELKSMQSEKSFSDNKKIFIVSANNFLLEAQNTLLKIFEDPIEDTHFFIVVPNVDILLKTLISRFYLIRTKSNIDDDLKEAEEFVAMSLKDRINFIKELLVEEEEDDEENLLVNTSSPRFKALKFLNALESVIHQKIILKNYDSVDINFFSQIFKVREFLSQPGSSIKSLMESIALIVPSF